VSGLVRACAATTCVLGIGLGGFGAWYGVRSNLPLPLLLTFILSGVLLVAIGVGLARRSRAAWSFAVAILGVLAVAGLLGVPALVRSGISAVAAGIALALVLGLLGALVAGRGEF
jgi:lysylphosphatidylglycerol synthetase-like protein (DUF2156 family)